MRYAGAEQFVPASYDLDSLREAAAACHGCDLWERATQTVFGQGEPDAPMMLVGEQPGDQEDRQGRPFVGPAGRVLDEAMEQAGIDNDAVYITNAVKHFRFQERGKRRIHQKPSRGQMVACEPWLRAEIETVSPDVLVLLGATAAQALLGPTFSVTRQRGRVDLPGVAATVATVHPSAILRAPGEERTAQMEAFVADLRLAAGLLA